MNHVFTVHPYLKLYLPSKFWLSVGPVSPRLGMSGFIETRPTFYELLCLRAPFSREDIEDDEDGKDRTKRTGDAEHGFNRKIKFIFSNPWEIFPSVF